MGKDIHVKEGGQISVTSAIQLAPNLSIIGRFSTRFLCCPSPPGGLVSPILVRPVREQLEHDRVIRLLLVKLKRKHEVIANIGEDQSTSIKIGQLQIYPGPRAHQRRPGSQADGDSRSRNLGIGQSPGSAVAMGPSRPGARPVSPLRPARLSRHRAPPGGRESRQRDRVVELSHDRGPDPFQAGATHAGGYAPFE